MEAPLDRPELSDVLISPKKLVADRSDAESSGPEEQGDFKNRLFLSPSMRVDDSKNFSIDVSSGGQSLKHKVLRLEALISKIEGKTDTDNAGQEENVNKSVSELYLEQGGETQLSDFDAPVIKYESNGQKTRLDTEPKVSNEIAAVPIDGANVQANSSVDADITVGEGFQSSDLEMFRKFISDVIREDLRGALGEKITSKIRKLVRVELEEILSSIKNN